MWKYDTISCIRYIPGFQGSLEVKLPTTRRDEKQSGEVEERKRKSQKKEDVSAQNVRKHGGAKNMSK